MFSRRDVLAASAMGAAMTVSAANAASFGNPDQPAEGAINAKNLASITDPGPQDPAIRDQLQSAFSPPPTDIGGMPQIWSSFNTVQRRIQDGGWARQVTQADFAISTSMPKNYGHYVQNIGDTDMQFFSVFRTSQFAEISLSAWLAHSPPEMVAEHLNVDPAAVPKWPGFDARILPARG